MNATAWIALGSNLGAREATLDGAVRALSELAELEIRAASSWIETNPMGGPLDQPKFLNGVLRCTTTLTPRDLLAALQWIEAKFGRDRTSAVRNGPRTLDLDLLMFDRVELREEELTLPHPGLEERVFVLEPLAEIDPALLLPNSQKTVSERLNELRVST